MRVVDGRTSSLDSKQQGRGGRQVRNRVKSGITEPAGWERETKQRLAAAFREGFERIPLSKPPQVLGHGIQDTVIQC